MFRAGLCGCIDEARQETTETFGRAEPHQNPNPKEQRKSRISETTIEHKGDAWKISATPFENSLTEGHCGSLFCFIFDIDIALDHIEA